MKTRIKFKNGRYYPQYRKYLIWWGFKNKRGENIDLKYKEVAKIFIEKRISKW